LVNVYFLRFTSDYFYDYSLLGGLGGIECDYFYSKAFCAFFKAKAALEAAAF